MTTYTRTQVDVFASRAGFTGGSLSTIVAIAGAESGWNSTPPDNVNNDIWHSRDRGILQINNHWQSWVSDACAYDPQCSFNAAYKISSNGTNFSAWSTYTSGAYTSYLASGPTSGFNAPPTTVTTSGLSAAAVLPFKTTDVAIQNAINNVPGFAGVIEALDVAEQFQPLTVNDSSGISYTTSVITGVPPITLPADAMQAWLVFIAVNTRAALIRSFLIFVGLVILIAVVQHIMSPYIHTGMQIAELGMMG
jgi:hypothetical protein